MYRVRGEHVKSFHVEWGCGGSVDNKCWVHTSFGIETGMYVGLLALYAPMIISRRADGEYTEPSIVC